MLGESVRHRKPPMATSGKAPPSNPEVLRPGDITAQSLVENEIQMVTATEAQIRCGCPEPGLAIPYRDLRDNKLVPLFDPENRPASVLFTNPSTAWVR